MFRRLWTVMNHPWLTPLLQQITLCRALVYSAAILGLLHLLGIPIPCLFSKLTGWPCAGCGITRATFAILRGEFQIAWQYHPFSVAWFTLGILITLAAIVPRFTKIHLIPKLRSIERVTMLPTLLLIAFFIFGLLRTIGVISHPPSL